MFCACCCAQCCESLGACCCAVCSLGTSRRVAKYIYGLLFLLALVLMWCLRDFGHTALMHLPSFKSCQPGDQACTAATVVLCTGLGMSLFFALMSATTTGARVDGGARDTWHSGWWPPKLLLWAALLGMTVFLPLGSRLKRGPWHVALRLVAAHAAALGGIAWHDSLSSLSTYLDRMIDVSSAFSLLPSCAGVLRIYGYVAVLGAVIFVVIQLVSMLNFVFVWNDTWQADKKWQVLAAVVTRVCYLAVAAAAALVRLFLMPSSLLPFSCSPQSPLSPQASVGSGGNRSVLPGSGSNSSAHLSLLYALLLLAQPLLFISSHPSGTCWQRW
ncbi:unnamed protein product [Closterium sp. NIES-65]|nr:unnamed protein product [Closterium sp. NIES-65]